MEKISWLDKVLRSVKEDKQILNFILQRKHRWIGHVLRHDGNLSKPAVQQNTDDDLEQHGHTHIVQNVPLGPLLLGGGRVLKINRLQELLKLKILPNIIPNFFSYPTNT